MSASSKSKNSSKSASRANVANSAGRMRRLKSASTLNPGETHVRVAVRCRPLSKKEITDGHKSIIEIESDKKIVVNDPSDTPSEQLGTMSGERRNFSRVYDFDAVFGCDSSQEDVYNNSCKQIVDSVLEGFNGTIFAYGQTGTGKTYTMEGLRKSNTDEHIGIMPRAFKQIFQHVDSHKDVQFLISASYLEIYQEQIHDLLRKDLSYKLELHEQPDTGVYVKDLTSMVCKCIADIEKIMSIGNKSRSVGATDMNEHSSRSHAILVVSVEQQIELKRKNSQDDYTASKTTTTNNKSNEEEEVDTSQRIRKQIRVGKLNFG